jgi:hypothetical protein
MMMNKRFLRGIPALLLVFVLIFAACENGLVEVEGTVGISAVEAPNLTATSVKGGVLLEWDAVLEVDGYDVWRKTGDTPPRQLGGSLSLDGETGKFRYVDLVSDTNELKADTNYTYIVFSKATGQKNQGRAEATAKPASIPKKGTKLDAVTGVTLELDYEANEAKVSWTIPAEAIPAGYSVQLYRDGYSGSSMNVGLGQKSATFSSSNGFSLQDGNYEARVYARSSGNNYFERGPTVASAKQKFEALFGNNGGINHASINSYDSNTNGISLFYVYINIASGTGKPGVLYTFQRAEADELGNVGEYADISVYGASGSTVKLGTDDLTADVLGNLQYSQVWDNSLPATHGKSYKYRMVAKKGDATQEREYGGSVDVDLRNYAIVNVNIGQVASAGVSPNLTQTYSVTSSVTVKNTLQTGDKLVFYYVKGQDSDGIAQKGPYAKIIEFSKAELEAAIPSSKNLVIPKLDGTDTEAYVVIRLEYADGTLDDVSSVWDVGNSSSIFGNGNSGNLYYQLPNY